MNKQPLIRIAQVVSHQPAFGWPTTAFEVENRSSGVSVVVKDPQEAIVEAEKMASASNGRIYRGHLPSGWEKALHFLPRS